MYLFKTVIRTLLRKSLGSSQPILVVLHLKQENGFSGRAVYTTTRNIVNAALFNPTETRPIGLFDSQQTQCVHFLTSSYMC